jgi:hypothetical protein
MHGWGLDRSRHGRDFSRRGWVDLHWTLVLLHASCLLCDQVRTVLGSAGVRLVRRRGCCSLSDGSLRRRQRDHRSTSARPVRRVDGPFHIPPICGPRRLLHLPWRIVARHCGSRTHQSLAALCARPGSIVLRGRSPSQHHLHVHRPHARRQVLGAVAVVHWVFAGGWVCVVLQPLGRGLLRPRQSRRRMSHRLRLSLPPPSHGDGWWCFIQCFIIVLLILVLIIVAWTGGEGAGAAERGR